MFADPAQYNEASHVPDMARLVDSVEDHVAELAIGFNREKDPVPQIIRIVRRLLDEHRLDDAVDVEKMSGRDILAQVIAMIAESDRPVLTAKAVDLVFQLGVFGGNSETEMARQENCTRSNVCHYVMRVKDRFFYGKKIPWLRSEEARKVYSKRQQGKQIETEQWAFAEVLKK